jgi:predicted RNA-binding protein with RPS1 domain
MPSGIYTRKEKKVIKMADQKQLDNSMEVVRPNPRNQMAKRATKGRKSPKYRYKYKGKTLLKWATKKLK